MSEKEVKKYMAFAKKNNIPLKEAITRFIKSKGLVNKDDFKVIFELASMVYYKEAA